MANRTFHNVQATQRAVKKLYCKVAIGATGAPTLDSVLKLGVTSIARNSAGLYTLTLADKYNNLLTFDIKQVVASAQDLTFQLAADNVASAGTLQFTSLAAATATDPSSGSSLLITLDLKNTGVER